jgi:hypothetical protein
VIRIAAALALSLLSATLMVPVQAQEHGNSIHIPDSSIERDEDLGRRAHTNHHQLIGPDGGAAPGIGLGPAGGMSADQMHLFYGLPPVAAGGGSGVIAIVDAYHYPTAAGDFVTFSNQFGLPTVAADGTTPLFQVVTLGTPTVDVGWNQEAALDIEWAHAMAPTATIVLVEAQSSSFTDLFAAVDAARALPGVAQVSMSWGSSEFSTETDGDVHFQYSATTGNPVFFAATGDQGGKTSFPAVSSLVVGVGGTSVATTSAGKFSSETGWSGSGGGPSSYVAKPSWQNGVENTSATMRCIPDVSSNADPNTGVSVYGWGYNRYRQLVHGWMVFGGTSVSTPCMAGMVNLGGASYPTQFAQGKSPTQDPSDTPTVAFLNLVYSGRSGSTFRDITKGSSSRKYSCKPGWDFVTGVGVPNGTGF